MAYLAANDLQVIAVQAVTKLIATPAPIDIAPASGETTPQTHAWAYLTG